MEIGTNKPTHPLFFRAALKSCRSSQARDLIGVQLLALLTATPMPDLSCVCSLHNNSWQCWILNPLSEARD